MYDPSKEPLITQKEKLAKRLNSISNKESSLVQQFAEYGRVPNTECIDIILFRYALKRLPNSVLAKVIKAAKAKVKELNIELKELKREQKQSAKEKK